MTSHKDSYIGRMYQLFMVNSRQAYNSYIYINQNGLVLDLKRVVPSFYFSTPCYEGRSVPKKSCHSVLHINSSRWNKDGFKPKKSVRKKLSFLCHLCVWKCVKSVWMLNNIIESKKWIMLPSYTTYFDTKEFKLCYILC